MAGRELGSDRVSQPLKDLLVRLLLAEVGLVTNERSAPGHCVIVPRWVERSPDTTEDKSMKLHCPTCNRPVVIGNASRYKVFGCACGRKFRGIHAEECLADYLFWKFAGPTMRLFTFGLAGRIDQNKLNYTFCPYCDAEISISYSRVFLGVTGPSNCWACTNKLPTGPVNSIK